ncbi:MAG: glycosyl hydrolase family 39 [Acidobacteriota bacterium]
MIDLRKSSQRTILFLLAATLPAIAQTTQPVNLNIDARATTTPFPHFWEQTFGSGRAILALRDDYRYDLQQVKQATDFKSVRFHAIFHDEVGLYDPGRQLKDPSLPAEAANDRSVYNFSYVDQIYDGLLASGVRPYVELSFMPRKMSSDPTASHPFWYAPNVNPPKDYKLWDDMITTFAQHLIARYGIDEVATWDFEVWNEPNLDFWMGSPKQSTYFTLYDHTARALKAVSPRLIVGGPSTAQAGWVPDFLKHTHDNNVPVDFVSTHVYANDTSENVFHTSDPSDRQTMVYRAVKMVHDQIAASAYPNIPLIFSEYNATYTSEPDVTDSPYMGPWLANNIRLCDGLVNNMAYWAFSDVFEEGGVPRTPFYGGFGLIANDRIPKASFNIFAALHKLGTERIPVDSDSTLATRTADGHLVLALWDYAPPTGIGHQYTKPSGPAGPSKDFTVHIDHVSAHAAVTVWRIDDDHSNVLKAFDAMGRPDGSLTQDQIRQLRIAGQMSPPEHLHLDHNNLHLTVPAHGLAVVVFEK